MDGPFVRRRARSFALATFMFLVLLTAFLHDAGASDETTSPAARVGQLLREHWEKAGVEPAKPAPDAAFLRRLTLDLTGRIPTEQELDAFLQDQDSDKRRKAITRLLDGPEFALHFGSVLDEMIQGNYAGNQDFVDYLRRSLRARKSWDVLFREMMVGPWDREETKPANRFLDKRARSSDVLTVDASRVFFGVDISCAQCHDHPLVADWTQDHFYGMMSFFHRTTGGKGTVGEKKEGEVTFLAGGSEKTAKMMFLSGDVVDDSSFGDDAGLPGSKSRAAVVSRRSQLVEIALEQRTFLSRALVNRLWETFFGRGLVTPVDQMHSGNESAVPGLLEWLADDFADHGYDLRRLVDTLVSTQAYQLSSRWESDSPLPDAAHFAVAPLRPLSRQQMATSLLLATGHATLSPTSEADRRIEKLTGVAGLQRLQQRLQLEEQARDLLAHFDPRESEFQSSAAEALFLSNAPAAQRLFSASEGKLAARLAGIDETSRLVDAAIRAVLTRPSDDSEIAELAAWLEAQSGEKPARCERLVWALVSSAEFRFNH